MPAYMFQVTYTREAWAAQIKNPSNRLGAVAEMIRDSGGKVVASYYAFGPKDVVIIAEMPDNTATAAFAISVAASGAVSSLETTVLMSPEEGLAAIKAAGKSSYRPPA